MQGTLMNDSTGNRLRLLAAENNIGERELSGLLPIVNEIVYMLKKKEVTQFQARIILGAVQILLEHEKV